MKPSATPVRVLVADDEPLVRTGIVGILGSDPAIEVVAQASDGAEALRGIDAHRPDVALVDIQMPGMTGLEALRRLRVNGNGLPCLFVTTFGEDDYIAEAIRLGADGFVLKSGDPHQLLTAVHAVAGHGAFFSPSIARRLLDSVVSKSYSEYADSVQRFERLTPREQEILVRLSQGETNTEIAAALHLAPGTVKVHVSSILRTTEARNRVEAALIAIRARRA
ncbi:response regulator transcription factor [Nocardiopsis sp. HUAS JQ3]|uniref:response regulator n=1 Tax=Nocardiopsis sp. HUAS JQ3 TaxID=3061629 RepID=UPI0023A9E452|nr:response regulator transcription factor [Nocardiopsis sp. HUAS JQ3]WDZ91016.1 response regulator transcription factor [Nocardiopsis sp. HUAS JQ3]